MAHRFSPAHSLFNTLQIYRTQHTLLTQTSDWLCLQLHTVGSWFFGTLEVFIWLIHIINNSVNQTEHSWF